MAVTIGAFLYKFDEIPKNVVSFVAILGAQITGSLFGTLLTFAVSNRVLLDEQSVDSPFYYMPPPKPLCPSPLIAANGTSASMGKGSMTQFVVGDVEGPFPESFDTCHYDGLYGNVFAIEFLCSFVLVFAWLIVRNYEVTGDMSAWQHFVKPLFVLVINAGSYVLSASISAGPQNPTLAL